MSGAYKFNKAMLRLNRINVTPEEKKSLLATVAGSAKVAELYLRFLECGCLSMDPSVLGFDDATMYRLLKLFEGKGLIEKMGRHRNSRGVLKWVWRLVC